MTAPIVLGLDLSLTATGVAGPDAEWTLTTHRRGMERLFWFREQIRQMVEGRRPELVAIEGYSFSSKNSHAHALGELGGVVRLALFDLGVTFVDVPPASLKKYATGKGNSGKEAVLAAAIRRLGYAGHDNNQSDAMWLRAMALDAVGHPLVDVPAVHRAALEKVEWPT